MRYLANYLQELLWDVDDHALVDAGDPDDKIVFVAFLDAFALETLQRTSEDEHLLAHLNRTGLHFNGNPRGDYSLERVDFTVPHRGMFSREIHKFDCPGYLERFPKPAFGGMDK